jgi:hypothetical protein
MVPMSRQGAHDWFGKVNNGKQHPALKAMRMLLED